MLVFDEDIGAALGKACEQDSDSDAARAAQIVHRNIFRSNPFTGLFEENCQEKSVTHQLLALVSMVLTLRTKLVSVQHQHHFLLPR